MKALSVFSSYQTSSLMIATMLLATLFGISAYALSSLASQADDKASQSFNESAQTFNTDEGKANFRDNAVHGLSNNRFAKEYGNQSFLDAQNLKNSSIASANSLHESGNLELAFNGATAHQTGEAIGLGKGLINASGSNSLSSMTNFATKKAETQQTLSTMRASHLHDQLEQRGNGNFVNGANSQTKTSVATEVNDNIQQEGLNKEFGADQVSAMKFAPEKGKLNATTPELFAENVKTQTQRGLGENDAFRDVSESTGKSIQSITQ